MKKLILSAVILLFAAQTVNATVIRNIFSHNNTPYYPNNVYNYNRYNYPNYRYNNSYYPQNYYVNNQYRPPIFTGSTGSGWKNMLWGNFKNQFAGTPTGFTPAMDPAYMDYFEAERAMGGDQMDYQTRTKVYRNKTNRSSGTGVTILD